MTGLPGNLPAKLIHVEVPRQVGSVNASGQVQVSIQQPGEMFFDQPEVVLIRPEHPLPIGMLFATRVAPSLEFGGKLGCFPALVEQLRDDRRVRGRTTQELCGRHGRRKTRSVRGRRGGGGRRTGSGWARGAVIGNTGGNKWIRRSRVASVGGTRCD